MWIGPHVGELISADSGCSQKRLARRLGMHKSAVVAIIHDMGRQDLAERMRHAHDRRLRAHKITPPKGQAFLWRTRPFHGPDADPPGPFAARDRTWRALPQADRSAEPQAGNPRRADRRSPCRAP
jgi:hypothetical protein